MHLKYKLRREGLHRSKPVDPFDPFGTPPGPDVVVLAPVDPFGAPVDRNTHFGSRGSPYGDGQLFRRGAARQGNYALQGVAAASNARTSAPTGFRLLVGMNAIAEHCKRHGFCPGGGPNGPHALRFARETSLLASELAALIDAGAAVPDWAIVRIEHAFTDIADVKHFLSCQRALAAGQKLSIGAASHFQAAAVRLGRLRAPSRRRGRRGRGRRALVVVAPAKPCFNHVTWKIEGGPLDGVKPLNSQVAFYAGSAYIYLGDEVLVMRICRPPSPAARRKKGLGAMLIGACCNVLGIGSGSKKQKFRVNTTQAMQLAQRMAGSSGNAQPFIPLGIYQHLQSTGATEEY